MCVSCESPLPLCIIESEMVRVFTIDMKEQFRVVKEDMSLQSA